MVRPVFTCVDDDELIPDPCDRHDTYGGEEVGEDELEREEEDTKDATERGGGRFFNRMVEFDRHMGT